MPLDIITLNQWLFSALLLGGILFLGLFHIVIYLVRKKLSIHLFFGMICISLLYGMYLLSQHLTCIHLIY